MNILYLLDNPQLYGSELHLLDIVKYMKKNNNIYVVVFKNGPLLKLLKEIGVNYEILESGYFPKLKVLLRIKKIVRKNNIQLIHSHQPKALFIGLFVKMITQTKYVCTIHSQPQDNAIVYRGIKKKVVLLFHHLITILVLKFANKIICVSKYMFNKFRKNKKVVLIYNWLRPEFIKNICKDVTKKNTNIDFLSVGSVTQKKGYDKLFAFVDFLINKNIHNIHFTIVGGINDKFIQKEKEIYSNAVFEKITFEGYKELISKYYQKSRYFILFSTAETFGLVFVEAMYFGLPIISSKIPVVQEILPKGNCISNDFDEILKYVKKLENNKNCYELQKKVNVKMVESNFNYEMSMKKTLFLYKECVNENM